MLTVLSALTLASEYFEKKGITSPRTNAEILLANILNCKRLDLYLRFDQPLKETEVELYRQFIARRGKYEPVQYIVGNTEFYGLTIDVNPSVLIPRPETEILVETILNQLKVTVGTKILDIGSGSGNISIALGKNLPDAEITSLDISEEAIKLAQHNANKNNVCNINFVNGSIISNGILSDQQFDIIVSNPPYVSIEEYPELQKEITMYEPVNAVTDNEDGLKFYKKISEFTMDRLVNGGSLFFEIGMGQSTHVSSIMTENGFHEINVVKDYQQIDRIIYGIKK
ncbi:MAG: peptide chain release factor N(5)-glutamine methyltransferase [Melioribacter sp.]|nr:peptide chain release factor N(5)-glutamine methyltransferase [Melioribacter sp.]